MIDILEYDGTNTTGLYISEKFKIGDNLINTFIIDTNALVPVDSTNIIDRNYLIMLNIINYNDNLYDPMQYLL